MTSTEIAQLVIAAKIGIAALVLTSLQSRVLRRPPPRRRAYLLAWVVCVVIVGGLIWVTDIQVGNTSLTRRVNSALLVGGVGATALAAGAWVHGRFPREGKRGLRGLALFLTHLAIVLAAAWIV